MLGFMKLNTDKSTNLASGVYWNAESLRAVSHKVASSISDEVAEFF
jgi:hypothetical protein